VAFNLAYSWGEGEFGDHEGDALLNIIVGLEKVSKTDVDILNSQSKSCVTLLLSRTYRVLGGGYNGGGTGMLLKEFSGKDEGCIEGYCLRSV